MSKEITILLPSTTTLGSFTSPKQKGAGYHRYNDGIHTFVISFTNWSGLLSLQATLVLEPGDDDWFTLKDANNQEITLGDDSSDYDQPVSVNSRGNFVWIRAVGSITAGQINEIRYNY